MGISKKERSQLQKLRQGYLNYIYNKYIYNVLLQVQHDDAEKYVLALDKSYEDKTLLTEYMALISEEDKLTVQQWKNAICGEFHVINGKEPVLLYNEKKKKVYQAFPIDETIRNVCLNAPIEMAFRISLLPFKGKFVIETSYILPEYNSSMKHLEKLYEDSLRYRMKNGVLVYPRTYEPVAVHPRGEGVSLHDAFLDFIAPFDLHILDEDTLQQLCTIGVLAWNDVVLTNSNAKKDVEEDDLELFEVMKNRKKKLFPTYTMRIASYEITHHKDGVRLIIEGV